MAKITITTTVRVEVDIEKWAAEYVCTPLDAEEDALKYVPELLVAGLERQKSWGIITEVGAYDTKVARREAAEEDSAAPAPGTLTIASTGGVARPGPTAE